MGGIDMLSNKEPVFVITFDKGENNVYTYILFRLIDDKVDIILEKNIVIEHIKEVEAFTNEVRNLSKYFKARILGLPSQGRNISTIGINAHEAGKALAVAMKSIKLQGKNLSIMIVDDMKNAFDELGETAKKIEKIFPIKEFEHVTDKVNVWKTENEVKKKTLNQRGRPDPNQQRYRNRHTRRY